MKLLRIDERSSQVRLGGKFTARARCGTYGTMNVMVGICGRLRMGFMTIGRTGKGRDGGRKMEGELVNQWVQIAEGVEALGLVSSVTHTR
jgi:hypothetical protein